MQYSLVVNNTLQPYPTDADPNPRRLEYQVRSPHRAEWVVKVASATHDNGVTEHVLHVATPEGSFVIGALVATDDGSAIFLPMVDNLAYLAPPISPKPGAPAWNPATIWSTQDVQGFMIARRKLVASQPAPPEPEPADTSALYNAYVQAVEAGGQMAGQQREDV